MSALLTTITIAGFGLTLLGALSSGGESSSGDGEDGKGGGSKGGGKGASPNAGKRVVPPQTVAQKRAAKTVMCNCYRGGAQDFDALVRCTLKSVYPTAGINWKKANVEAQTNGVLHPDTQATVRLVRKWATTLLSLQSEAKRQAWCSKFDGDSTPPGPPEPPPPPPPPDPGMTEVERKARVRELFAEVRGATGPGARSATFWKPGGYQVKPSNMVELIRDVMKTHGIEATPAQRTEYGMMIERSQWNQALYGRNAEPQWNLQVNGRTVRAAFRPAHKDADQVIIAQGKRPGRNIRNDGSRNGAGTSYGLLWLPGIDLELLESTGVMAPLPGTEEPPGELLSLLDAAP